VLARKFRRHTAAMDRFDSLWACAEVVPDVAEPAHDADARLVASARSAGAELFVTGDQRVLGWDTSAGMRLLSPRQAWEWVARAAPGAGR
jgi:predicted nucleic acid-binding protein